MVNNWDRILEILQLILFLLARVLDDLTWYDLGVDNEVVKFESVGIACLIVCVVLQILRKYKIEGMFRILFIRSQMKFMISWSLVITIAVLFFNIFGCEHHVAAEGAHAYFYINYGGCCINCTVIMLTNLNFSLICNTKAQKPELILYEAILFAEVIFNAHLILFFISHLEHESKDQSIVLVSIIIANQVLIMDLIFRAAYEDREREQEKEEKLLHRHGYRSSTHHEAKTMELTLDH